MSSQSVSVERDSFGLGLGSATAMPRQHSQHTEIKMSIMQSSHLDLSSTTESRRREYDRHTVGTIPTSKPLSRAVRRHALISSNVRIMGIRLLGPAPAESFIELMEEL